VKEIYLCEKCLMNGLNEIKEEERNKDKMYKKYLELKSDKCIKLAVQAMRHRRVKDNE
jgi:hypothetical protein